MDDGLGSDHFRVPGEHTQTAEAAPCTCVGSDPRTQSERSYALQGRFQALDGSQLKEPTNGIIMLRRLSRVITPDGFNRKKRNGNAIFQEPRWDGTLTLRKTGRKP